MLIHGGLHEGERAWSEQLALHEWYALAVPDRVGYGASADLGDAEDFERDAELLAEIIEPGCHVVGHSSGALAALLLAASVPDRVASLVLVEPPAFQLAPEASELLRLHENHFDRTDLDPVPWLRGFFELNALEPPPDDALEPLGDAAQVWRRLRRPWHGELPLETVALHPFAKLVVSGGHSSGFEAVCDVIADRLGADRAVIPGAGHAVQLTGAAFNQLLTAFWNTSAHDSANTA